MAKKKKEQIVKNIVAKFAQKFNRAVVFQDKTKYNRTVKHRCSDTSLLFA